MLTAVERESVVVGGGMARAWGGHGDCHGVSLLWSGPSSSLLLASSFLLLLSLFVTRICVHFVDSSYCYQRINKKQINR